MKYTKKQIERAYVNWETNQRLNPTNFFTEKEQYETDVKEYARLMTKELIEYINKLK